MSRFLRTFPLLLALVSLLASGAASAEQAEFSNAGGDYEIHYIAVNSTFLQPEIAAQYNIVRSARSAFLNIAVLRKEADGSTTPVTAVLSGSKHNMLQQSEELTFSEVREGAAVYYIGQFGFSNAEILRFVVSVQPEGQGEAHELEWRTQLYAQ